MTVDLVGEPSDTKPNGYISCQWFTDNKVQSSSFPPDSLENDAGIPRVG